MKSAKSGKIFTGTGESKVIEKMNEYLNPEKFHQNGNKIRMIKIESGGKLKQEKLKKLIK